MINTALYIMFFDAGKFITWASGRGLGPGNFDFFGPCQMASSRAITQGLKKSRFPTPSHLGCPRNKQK